MNGIGYNWDEYLSYSVMKKVRNIMTTSFVSQIIKITNIYIC